MGLCEGVTVGEQVMVGDNVGLAVGENDGVAVGEEVGVSV